MAKNNDGKRTNFEIETQIEYLSQESIEEILTTRWEKKQIVCYVYCLHDKDTYTNKDEEEGKGKYGEHKTPRNQRSSKGEGFEPRRFFETS